MRLRLVSRDGRLLSDNFYWQARREEDHRGLNDLPRVGLVGTALRRTGPAPRVDLELRNPATSVALMVRPTLRTATGERVLPAYATDGYFALLPGETRRVTIESPGLASATQVTLDGWNVEPLALRVRVTR